MILLLSKVELEALTDGLDGLFRNFDLFERVPLVFVQRKGF